jgi:hypothetical protein
VLWGTGLCDELITRPGESYRMWCVVVCDLENLKNEEAMTRVGSQRHSEKKILETNIDHKVYKNFLPLPAATGLTADFRLPVLNLTLLR